MRGVIDDHLLLANKKQQHTTPYRIPWLKCMVSVGEVHNFAPKQHDRPVVDGVRVAIMNRQWVHGCLTFAWHR